VTATKLWLDEHWNWRLSGHCRVASLASVWLLALLTGAGWLLLPLAVLRTVASMAQSLANIRLGRSNPVGGTDRYDWALIASIFVAGEVLAAVHEYQGVQFNPLTLLPMLVPFTVLQARMCWRSYHAPIIATPQQATIIRMERFTRARAA
jgi:hypothetical protein